MSNYTDPFWLQDISILTQTDRLVEFFPSTKMSFSEKLNAIVRFAWYSTLAFALYAKNWVLVLLIPFIVMIGTMYLFNVHKSMILPEDESPVEDPTICQLPTVENPFGNVNIVDWEKNQDRPAACDTTTKSDQGILQNLYDKKTYRDVKRIFRTAGDYNYYTTPSTTIPNDRKKFAEWLYKPARTCKEDPNSCLRDYDIRRNRN